MEKKNKVFLALIFAQVLIILALLFVFIFSSLNNGELYNKLENSRENFQDNSDRFLMDWVDYYGPLNPDDSMVYNEGQITVNTDIIPYYEGTKAFFAGQYREAIDYFEINDDDVDASLEIVAKIKLYMEALNKCNSGDYQKTIDLLEDYETLESDDLFDCELKYLLAEAYILDYQEKRAGKVLAGIVKNTDYLVMRFPIAIYEREKSNVLDGTRSLYTEMFFDSGRVSIIRYYIDYDEDYDGFSYYLGGHHIDQDFDCEVDSYQFSSDGYMGTVFFR